MLGQCHLVRSMNVCFLLILTAFSGRSSIALSWYSISRKQSPTGYAYNPLNGDTSTHSGSGVSGPRRTTFLPPMDTIPDLSDFQSLSESSTRSLSCQPSLRLHAVDDATIVNQTIVYPGDPQVISPSCSRNSSLLRTTSMIHLGEEFEFESALRRAKDM